MSRFHTSVFVKKILEFLRVTEKAGYIDATLGGGGHSFEIVKRGGRVLGIDVDKDAIEHTAREWNLEAERSQIPQENLRLVRGNFRDIKTIAAANGFDKVAGIIFDLGVSGYQLETPERGFSFKSDGPLDMRMDQELSVKAADLINGLSKGELYELFTKLGEERFARVISESIVSARGMKNITTTSELSEITRGVYTKRGQFSKIDPSTKVFQALRIAVNDEMHSLQAVLPDALELLEKNGRLLVITFHSLEDRIVKRSFAESEEKGLGHILTKKPVEPDDEEIGQNRRARSAKLRVFEKN